MTTLLITWWLGYIGSHAVVEFEKAGYKTVIVDNLSNSKIEVLGRIEKILWYRSKFYKVDLLDKSWLEKVFKENKFDWVLHFAGLKAVWESCEKPILYFQNNISGSLNLFELMDKYRVKNIIFSSSATVYDVKSLPEDAVEIIWNDFILKRWLRETDPVWNTTNPYWRTKFIIEQILQDLAKFAWFKVISLRYFNPIWAHPSGLLWEDPRWIPNNLMPYIMKVLKWELNYLKIFWWDWPTKDWTWVRDYIDIMDLIEGHLAAWKYLESRGLKSNKRSEEIFLEIFNLWVWRWVSVLEMVKLVEKVSGKKVPYKIVERRPGDLAEVWCDASKAEKELWWKAKRSLEESIESMLRFYGIN